MVTNDLGKLFGLLVIAVLVVALMFTGRVDDAAGFGLLGGIVGYFTGNGVNAVRKQAPSPALVAKLPAELVDDAAAKQAAVQIVEEAADRHVAVQAEEQGWPYEPEGRHTAGGSTLAGPPWKGWRS